MFLKVAFLSYLFGKDNLGTGRSSWHLVEELRKLGVDVDVYEARPQVKTFGPPIFYLKNGFTRFNKYDILHSNEGAGMLVYHPTTIETYHHNYGEMPGLADRIFSELERFHCKRVKHIIVPSIKTKSALISNGFPDKKITIISHGVDGNTFKRLPNRVLLREKYKLTNKFVAINVGQLVPRKRQVDAVKLLAGIKDAVLILVGKGPEEVSIRKAAVEYNVKVLRFQDINEQALVELYNVSDIYLNTSILEGFGLTILEAMSCEVPIIAYDVADFKSIVGDSGFILEKGDVNGARAAIELLMSNRGLRQFLAEAAFCRSKGFNWQSVAKHHLELYAKMLS